MEESKQNYFIMSENTERMGSNLELLEKRYEKGQANLKELQRDSKNFADLKIETELAREHYRTAVVIYIILYYFD